MSEMLQYISATQQNMKNIAEFSIGKIVLGLALVALVICWDAVFFQFQITVRHYYDVLVYNFQ